MKRLLYLIFSTIIITNTNLVAEDRSPTLLEDIDAILSSETAKKACTEIQLKALQILRTNKQSVPFLRFLGLNMTVFSKWPEVCADFVSEVMRTMPVDDILSSMGITKKALPKKSTTVKPVCSAEENALKDSFITKIIKNSPHSMTGLLSVGIGYLTSFLWKNNNEHPNELSPEEHLQNAFRFALKNNYTLDELKALHEFSETEAYKILVAQFDNFKSEFIRILSEDEKIMLIFERQLTALMTQSQFGSQNIATDNLIELESPQILVVF